MRAWKRNFYNKNIFLKRDFVQLRLELDFSSITDQSTRPASCSLLLKSALLEESSKRRSAHWEESDVKVLWKQIWFKEVLGDLLNAESYW